LVDFFDTKGFSVYQRIVRYGLNENEYMYEVHIL
ncbi:HP0268 family nuclease, partial [uncultured Campylobacter sp.]